MKFEISHRVGDDKIFVVFMGDFLNFKKESRESFIATFQKLGGILNQHGVWTFPLFITFQILEEIIRNTCFECGGLMRDGQAIQNGKVLVSSYDNAVDTYEGEIKYPDTNNHLVINVRKCLVCGHSHTL